MLLDQNGCLMENVLKEFSALTDETTRREFALKQKKQGQKIIGYLDPYIPEEIICAFGMFPWHIRGTGAASTPLASIYRPRYTSLYCLHVLESLLKGELDFLDGIIMTDWDDDHKRLWDQIRIVLKAPFCPLLHVPQIRSPVAIHFFAERLKRLAQEIQNHFKVDFSLDRLESAVDLFNGTRDLLSELYKLKKTKNFVVSGTDTFIIVNAAMTMPKKEFNTLMSKLLLALKNKEDGTQTVQCRLLLSSDWLDQLPYIELIENSGAYVVMDDLTIGSRYFWGKVDLDCTDLWYGVAKRYLSKPPCPRMAFWNETVNQITNWVSDYRIHGVINFPELYDWPRRFYDHYLRSTIRKRGTPVITINREYHFSNVGQIQTRIDAFLETLSTR